MINLTGSVAEATEVELIGGDSDNSYLVVSVRTCDQETTQIRIGHEHIKRLADVLPRDRNLRGNTTPSSAAAGYLVVGAERINLNVDPMGDQVFLALDQASGLRFLLPLTVKLADRLAEVGCEASRLLRSIRGPKTVN
ncbi:hypothetical protein [Inquilinus sp.]|jgi:hypothetical protein|uniref:hypothetical protein n=1 Tax=Inquilinus sp. TaxID=1932117 RepID=UPI0037840756